MYHNTSLVLTDETDALNIRADVYNGIAVVRFGEGVQIQTSVGENPAELLAQTLIRVAGDLRKAHRQALADDAIAQQFREAMDEAAYLQASEPF